MNKTQTIAVILGSALILFTGCGSSSTTENKELNQTESNTTQMETSIRFESVVISGDTIQRDNQTKLEWVASVGTVNVACSPHAAVTTEEADIAAAQAHCDALTFAGYSDWRVPTSSEHVRFITDMNSTGQEPFYLSPKCFRVIGIDANNTAQTVNTHYHPTNIAATTPWSTLITQESETNFGVKCVRDF